jgi:hypothetical protein
VAWQESAAQNDGLPHRIPAGILNVRVTMMNRSRLAAVFFSALVLAPVLAAGRPACCKAPAVPVASHGCCAAMSGAQASAPKGCCKAPMAPKTETRAQDGAPVALTIPSTLHSPALMSAALPSAVLVRLARRAHHAAAPDDSPPDLLSQNSVLLI